MKKKIKFHLHIKSFQEHGKIISKSLSKERSYIGIVRDTEKSKNGIFIELAPNLVGLAEYKDNVEYGQNVDVYIKKIIPEKKKVKLLIFNEEE